MSNIPGEVILRAATNADCPQIRDVVFKVFAEHGFEPEVFDSDLDDIEQFYLSRGGLFEVIERNGRIVGTVGLLPTSNGGCELRKLYLAREERGRGFGKLMVERMIQAAREQGYRRMDLETITRLSAALHLYERFGFVRVHQEAETDRCDVVMTLEL